MRAAAAGTPRRPPPPLALPRSPRPPPRHATSYLQVTCFVQPPPLPSLPPPPPPAPGDGAATVGIEVREAAATAAAAAPAPDVVAVVPGAAASAITVYPTQQWPRNFRDHIVPVRLRRRRQRREGRAGEGRGGRLRSPRALRQSRALSPRLRALWSRELRAPLGARGPPPATLIGKGLGPALKGRDHALSQVCWDGPGLSHQRTTSKDHPLPMAGGARTRWGKVWGCVCSLSRVRFQPIVLGSVSFSPRRTVATVSQELSESLLMEVPRWSWRQTS